jgi:hypothetical protein
MTSAVTASSRGCRLRGVARLFAHSSCACADCALRASGASCRKVSAPHHEDVAWTRSVIHTEKPAHCVISVRAGPAVRAGRAPVVDARLMLPADDLLQRTESRTVMRRSMVMQPLASSGGSTGLSSGGSTGLQWCVHSSPVVSPLVSSGRSTGPQWSVHCPHCNSVVDPLVECPTVSPAAESGG